MDRCRDYEDCIYFKTVETDYDVTNGHSSYRDYCTRTGQDRKIIGHINCPKCHNDQPKTKMTDIEKALKYFEKMRDSAMVVLDSGFGENEGENNIIYRKRIKYASIAVSALEKQMSKKVIEKVDELNDKDFNGLVQRFYCPNCHYEIDEHNSPVGCKFCLQNLDWSDIK